MNLKKKWLFLFMVIAMCLGLVSSALVAKPTIASLQSNQLPEGYTVARVYFTSQEDLASLATSLDIWEVNHKDGYLVAMLSPQRAETLRQAGYRLVVDQAKTDLLYQPLVPLEGQGTDSIPGFPCYRTVEETYTDLTTLAAANPTLTEWTDVGDSWEKVMSGGQPGYDIYSLRITNEAAPTPIADRPTFFLMAEIHAREYTTAELATRFAEMLIAGYGVDPDITWLLDYFRVFIVPMTNPDGRKHAEAGDWWRKNTDSDDGCTDPNSWGTDLNRNHSYTWNMGGSSSAPCGETYMGPSAASEPETQVIETFASTLFPDQRGPGFEDPAPLDTTGVFITLHSYSQLVLWPYGFRSAPAPNDIQLQTLGRKFAYFNGYEPDQAIGLYPTSGTSDEWAYGTMGVAAYTFELGTQFFESCSMFENTILPDNLPALMAAFKSARLPYMNPSGPDSLDALAMPGGVAPGDVVQLTATANDTRFFDTVGSEPVQNIAEARYSVDDPSWVTGTPTYPMTASDGAFDETIESIQATIDTTGWDVGRHTIFIESKDANNNWGLTSAVFLYVLEPGVSPVIEGHVYNGTSLAPIPDATVSAGIFQSISDPTGYYSMTVISGTYNMSAVAPSFAITTTTGVVAQNFQTIQQDFYLMPICTFFSDDVENGNIGWNVQSPWAITTESYNSPTHSWTDSPGSNYGNNRNVSITSPVINASDYTGVTLSMFHQYQTESGYDFGNVEYSINGGAWQMAANYSGTQSAWIQENIPMSALDGQANVRIRFRFSSDGSVTGQGWHVDDIQLSGGGPGCVPPSAPTAEFTSNSPVPLGFPVQFTNLTAGTPPFTYLWDFGDGVGTSTESDPSYLYTAAGTYNVVLTATNAVGSDAITHPVVVGDSVNIAGVTLTQVTPAPGRVGQVVDFSADILPDDATKPYDYLIDFGDGTPPVTGSSSLDPYLFTHVYAAPGVFTVTIQVQNAGMISPVSGTLDVTVVQSIYLPVIAK